jgi:hypothetical protein
LRHSVSEIRSWLFLGIEVIEVAEKFVEAVHGRLMLVGV